MHKQSKPYDAEALARILADLDIAIPSELPEYGDPRPEFPAPRVLAAGKLFRVVGSVALVGIIDRAAVALREHDRRHAQAQAMERDADKFYGGLVEEMQSEMRQQHPTPARVLEAVS